MRRGLKFAFAVALLALTVWIGPARRSDAAYKPCSQMDICYPNGSWSACWNANLELVRCFCVGGHWDCSYP